MNRKLLSLSLLLLLQLTGSSLFAQYRAIVYFSDKGPIQPATELPFAASHLAQQLLRGQPLDERDWPPSATYLEQLRRCGLQVQGQSAWLNACLVKGSAAQLQAVRHLGFVRELDAWAIPETTGQPARSHILSTSDGPAIYGNAYNQVSIMQLDSLHKRGFRGQGVRLAIFDSGFPAVNQLGAFDSLRLQNRILDTWDFAGSQSNVFQFDSHGRACLSIITGNIAGQFRGSGDLASVLLARTEVVNTETKAEMFNWVQAVEWAHQRGAQVISSSLGYNTFDNSADNYTFSQMNGQTTIVVQGANTAAQKGILVVNAAGNEGGNAWGRITSPCDGPDVLCVGAVNEQNQIAGFSSRGPSADGRVKPEVVAMGWGTYTIGGSNNPGPGNGTSFACPMISGLAVSLLSANPSSSPAQVREAIIRSADRYEKPDTAYGYGLPNALTADSMLKAWGPATRDNGARASLKVHLMPNPASDFVKIWLQTDNFEPASYRILSTQGQLVQDWTSFTANVHTPVPVSHIANGFYQLHVQQQGQSTSIPLVVVR